MRVLLINPQAEFSFWTLPVSCRLDGAKTQAPPLGLITVAALLPDEWELRLADLNTRTPSEDDWNWSDIVMVSGMLGQRASLLAIVKEAKERGKRVVVGGPYPTAVPEEALAAGADFVVRGEGENTVPLLLDALRDGKKGGIIENQEKPDMSTSPVPRYDLLRLRDYVCLLIQTSRGCPFECEFCDVVSLFGRKPRYKSADQVIEELEAVYNLGWRRTVFIADDNFIGSKTHARAILEKLIPWQENKGDPVGFITQASVNLGRDPEMIDLMTAANFGSVFIGIESPDENVLTRTRKYQNVRNPAADAVAAINRNGLMVQGSFIIGFDGEKKGVDDRMYAFVDATGIPIVMINLLTAPPGTELWKRLEREGRLAENMFVGEYMCGDRMNFVPSRPETEILEEYVRTWDYLYEPERYLERVYRYYLNMRPTRAAIAAKKGKTVSRVPRARPPLRDIWNDLRALLLIVWWQGIRPRYRLRFWRQLIGIWRQNPSRIKDYVVYCAMGENFFRIRETLKNQKS